MLFVLAPKKLQKKEINDLMKIETKSRQMYPEAIIIGKFEAQQWCFIS